MCVGVVCVCWCGLWCAGCVLCGLPGFVCEKNERLLELSMGCITKYYLVNKGGGGASKFGEANLGTPVRPPPYDIPNFEKRY